MKAQRGLQIIEKAKEIGAAMAGIASLDLLKKSPSHKMLYRFGTKIDGVQSFEGAESFDEIKWPANAKSALVIAGSHPKDKLDLDWSFASGNTPGNRLLTSICGELSVWIEETFSIKAHRMPYWVEEGGIYLKDAAVLGGLGCIGKNNILITPELGPKVRLRAILLEAELTPTGPINFNPCDSCEQFCRKACPQNAFDKIILLSNGTGIYALPGRDGAFSRAKCSIQMDRDVADSGVAVGEGFLSELYLPNVDPQEPSQTEGRIKWCRRCELACPV